MKSNVNVQNLTLVISAITLVLVIVLLNRNTRENFAGDLGQVNGGSQVSGAYDDSEQVNGGSQVSGAIDPCPLEQTRTACDQQVDDNGIGVCNWQNDTSTCVRRPDTILGDNLYPMAPSMDPYAGQS